ncbi:hypothetical protein BpHYR1_026031 [Brachionus plicatilis]|uniref:Uncharacterized protein n=1 Tax=Brachionus plicatilis TaxID=10195 RepID=A0A3M7Q0I9_BRAPC|nr:hypothetical protein BpHYR1_026031 [Brachionus plicatilis]
MKIYDHEIPGLLKIYSSIVVVIQDVDFLFKDLPTFSFKLYNLYQKLDKQIFNYSFENIIVKKYLFMIKCTFVCNMDIREQNKTSICNTIFSI